MAKIKCPQCGNEIELDKNTYSDLLNDVAADEVARRVKEQTQALEEKYKAELNLEKEKAKNAQDREIQELKQKNETLEEQLKASFDLEKAKAQAEFDKKLTELQNKNTSLAETQKANLELAKAELRAELEKQINQLQQANASLKSQLENSDSKAQLAISEAKNASNEELNKRDQEIAKLKEQYGFMVKAKDEEIQRYKDFRMGDSTKDLGESLEQYCHDAFDEIRATAYPRAYFEKDNESDEEGKGDFIFKDYDDEGTLIVSIMFEMKNQKDTTKTKQKNEHFFEKLDKNRTSKGCEYAVLVSTLEEDSKLYNSGIVDVSHRYPKMFVVRPQHFLSIIGLIRTLSTNNLKYRKQVEVYQNQNLDISNFEEAVRAIGQKINADYTKANAIYNDVDKMCDDIIKKVEAFRKEFKVAAGHIGAAVNQLPNLEVRKLTKKNPTMKAKFDELKDND